MHQWAALDRQTVCQGPRGVPQGYQPGANAQSQRYLGFRPETQELGTFPKCCRAVEEGNEDYRTASVQVGTQEQN